MTSNLVHESTVGRRVWRNGGGGLYVVVCPAVGVIALCWSLGDAVAMATGHLD